MFSRRVRYRPGGDTLERVPDASACPWTNSVPHPQLPHIGKCHVMCAVRRQRAAFSRAPCHRFSTESDSVFSLRRKGPVPATSVEAPRAGRSKINKSPRSDRSGCKHSRCKHPRGSTQTTFATRALRAKCFPNMLLVRSPHFLILKLILCQRKTAGYTEVAFGCFPLAFYIDLFLAPYWPLL